MKRFTKAVLVIHRYLGFVMSLLFVIWFLSGFVMMYAGYPTMKYHTRLQQLPAADLSTCRVSPDSAVRLAHIEGPIKTFRLGMLLGRPVYRMATEKNQHHVVYADNGQVLDTVTEAMATTIARAFVNNTSTPVTVEVLTQIDQWMAAHRSQGYLPHVYRFTMDDAAKTYVYVTVQTGEVVQMVTAHQRFWAWLGPIPHWLYPTVLIRDRPLWSQVVIWTSGIGIAMCLTGIVMGIIRYKRRKGSRFEFSPYKKQWFRWHHYTGFIFGIFVFTWILSGFFSMSPIDFGPDATQQLAERKRWTGGDLNTAAFTVSPAKAAEAFSATITVKEIQLTQVHGKPYYLAYQDDHHTRMLAADNTLAPPFERFPIPPLTYALQGFHPTIPVGDVETLYEYDDYYYSSRKHDKRLPVLRVTFATPEQTWYYIDLKTGQLVMKHERGSRAERWLYHGLHSLDFKVLRDHRPLWDIVVGILMSGGTLVSVTGLVLTWKWLRRKATKMTS